MVFLFSQTSGHGNISLALHTWLLRPGSEPTEILVRDPSLTQWLQQQRPQKPNARHCRQGAEWQVSSLGQSAILGREGTQRESQGDCQDMEVTSNL